MKKIILSLALIVFIVFIPLLQNSYSQISFASYKNYPIEGTFSGHLTTGDFNNDGKTDVAVRTGFGPNEKNNWKLFVFLQGEDHTLLDPMIYPYHKLATQSGYERGTIASGDINNDGLCDIVIGFNDSIGIFLQNASGELNPEIDLKVGPSVDVIKIGDINNDGYNDIIISLWSQTKMVALFGDSLGNLSSPYYYPAIRGIDDIVIAKLGNDKYNSVIKMNGLISSLTQTSVFHINRDRTLDNVSHYNIPTSGNIPASVAVGNIYGLGNKLICSNYPHNISVWGNLTDTIPELLFDIPENGGALAVGDLNQDKKDEICMFPLLGNGIYVISNSVVANFPVPCPKGAYPDAIALADVNNDGKLDIVSCSDQNGLSVLINTTVEVSTNDIGNNKMAFITPFPNPCLDLLNIENTKEGKLITVSDNTGKIIKHELSQNEKTTLNLNSMKSGFYFINYFGHTFKIFKNY